MAMPVVSHLVYRPTLLSQYCMDPPSLGTARHFGIAGIKRTGRNRVQKGAYNCGGEHVAKCRAYAASQRNELLMYFSSCGFAAPYNERWRRAGMTGPSTSREVAEGRSARARVDFGCHGYLLSDSVRAMKKLCAALTGWRVPG